MLSPFATGKPVSVNNAIVLSVSREIAASPQQVWDVLIDLEAWPKWGPTISGAQLDEPYAQLTSGATGVVQTSVLVKAPFEITEFEPGRFWAWKVAGIPATSHRVDPVDDGARVTFIVPWWAAAYLTVCAVALRRIEKLTVDAR